MSIGLGQQPRPVATGRGFIKEVTDTHIRIKDRDACTKL